LDSLCTSAGLDAEMVAGLKPTWNDQSDAYTVIGEGPIEGCQVTPFGRFGNNVLQLAHAIAFARSQGLQWVAADRLGTAFRRGCHQLNDSLQVYIDVPPPDGGAALLGRYFDWWGLGSGLRRFQGATLGQVVRHQIAGVLDLDPEPTHAEQPQLHMHIRGGDVFGSQGTVHKGYVQPPLCYYTMVAEDWLERQGVGQVVVVSQDRLNPCVDALVAWAARRDIALQFVSSTERQDIGCLLAATDIVAGLGTFVPMIALASQTVRRLFFFRDPHQLAAAQANGIKVETLSDACGSYIARGHWENSPEQRQIMLKYPGSCLRWAR
jgi:hypothetical protein